MRRSLSLLTVLLVPAFAQANEQVDPAEFQRRAALLDLSWDLPENVLERIPGTGLTDQQEIEATLASLISPTDANVRLPFKDLSLGTAGPEATVRRSFNTTDTVSSEFGRGWAWSFGEQVAKMGDDLNLRDGNGRVVRFSKTTATSWASTATGETIVKKGDGYLRASTAASEASRYDKKGYLVERIDASGRKVTVQRGADARVLAIIAANGRKLVVKTDRDGRIVSMKDPAGRTAEYSYSGNRLAKSVVGGLETAYAYDEQGALTQVTFPDGSALRMKYAPSGIVEQASIGGRTVKAMFTQDKAQPALRGASLVDGAEVTRLKFDDKAGRAEILHPDGEKEVRRADLTSGALTESIYGDTKQRYQRDALGRIVRVNANDGHATLSWGDRAVSSMEIVSDGQKIAATFDATGNMTRVVADNRLTELSYENGLPSEIRIDGKVARRTQHDAKGDLVSITDENGRVLRIKYDAAGHVSGIERQGEASVDIAMQSGAFVPKVRLNRANPKGVVREVLGQSDMIYLYGSTAELKPTKRAALDEIPGVKLAGLGYVPMAAPIVLASCPAAQFFCDIGFSLKCLGKEILDAASPIGSPVTYDPKTGEYGIDPKGWVWNQIMDAFKDKAKDVVGDKIEDKLIDIAVRKQGLWQRIAQRANGLILVGKIAAKKLAVPIKIVMLIPKAWECSTGQSANSATLCDPARVCVEPPPYNPRDFYGIDGLPPNTVPLFLMP